MANQGRGVSSCQVMLRRTKYSLEGSIQAPGEQDLEEKFLPQSSVTCWSGRFSKEVVLFDKCFWRTLNKTHHLFDFWWNSSLLELILP